VSRLTIPRRVVANTTTTNKNAALHKFTLRAKVAEQISATNTGLCRLIVARAIVHDGLAVYSINQMYQNGCH